MESSKYTISWDQLKGGYNYSAEEVALGNEANKLAANGERFSEAFKNKLKRAKAKFPQNPSIKNYLFIAFGQENSKDELNELIEETLLKHPNYLFGKTMKAEVLLAENKLEEAAEFMKGFKDIGLLYPDRNEFHFSEIRAYYSVAVQYHFLNGDEESAIRALKKLDKFGIDIDQIELIAQTAERLRMRVRLNNIGDFFGSFKKKTSGERTQKCTSKNSRTRNVQPRNHQRTLPQRR